MDFFYWHFLCNLSFISTFSYVNFFYCPPHISNSLNVFIVASKIMNFRWFETVENLQYVYY